MPGLFIPFLAVIEVVRIVVRPITIGFRLLVNLSMGALLIEFLRGPVEIIVLGCWGWSPVGKVFAAGSLGLLWT